MPYSSKKSRTAEKDRERKRDARAASKKSPAAPASTLSALFTLAAVAAVASASRSPSIALAESPAPVPARREREGDGAWEIDEDQFHLLDVAFEDVVRNLQSRAGSAASAGAALGGSAAAAAAAAGAAAAAAAVDQRPLATHFRPFIEDGDGSCFFHGLARNHLGASALQYDVRRIMHQHATRNASVAALILPFLAILRHFSVGARMTAFDERKLRLRRKEAPTQTARRFVDIAFCGTRKEIFGRPYACGGC